MLVGGLFYEVRGTLALKSPSLPIKLWLLGYVTSLQCNHGIGNQACNEVLKVFQFS